MGSELPDGSVLVTWSDRGCFCKAPHHGGHKQWHGEKPLDFLCPNTGAAPGRTSSAQEWGEGNRQNCESPKTLNTVFFLYSHLSLPTRNQCWTPDKASCTGEFSRKTGVLHLRSPAAPQPRSPAAERLAWVWKRHPAICSELTSPLESHWKRVLRGWVSRRKLVGASVL